MRQFWACLFLLVPVAGLVVFVIAGTGTSWLPENISTTGHSIDLLFYLILAITGIAFLATEILLVYAMFSARGEANGKGRFLHGSNKLEVIWTFGTAVILVFIAVYQVPTWAKAKFSGDAPKDKSKPDALVTASQFLWQVRYPLWNEGANLAGDLNSKNPNLQESFELINELHVPMGKPFMLHLTTRDVLHSFWLPNVRVKQDAVPGHMIPVWFDCTKPGTYEWVCAELCGWGHYRMRAKLIVHEKTGSDSYNEWLKARTKDFLAGKPVQLPTH